MRNAQGRRITYTRPIGDLILGPWFLIPLALILGTFVSFQFFHITARYVKLTFGLLFLLGILRLPFAGAMSLFLVLFPAPTFITIGDSNEIFVALMTVIWMVRVGLRSLPRPLKSPIDWALVVYLGIHFASFINIRDPIALHGAALNMIFMTSGVLFYFLMVSAYRTEQHLRLALNALCVMAFLVDITAIAEYYYGLRVVPEWFLYGGAMGGRFEEGGRAGGVFGFHGLLADTSAMLFYVQIILGQRSRRLLVKGIYYLLAALSLLNVFNSVNRGGAIILVLGGIYLLWMARHTINWGRLVTTVLLVAVAGFAIGVASARLIERIRLLNRLAQTSFENGIAENRTVVWEDVLSRIPEHPWLGHGPYIDLQRGVGKGMSWPHNAYLFYLYTTGVAGLLAFLWILIKVIRQSRPRGRIDFVHGSFPRAVQALYHIQLVMFAVAQMRDEHQRGNVYNYWMWILFGLAVCSTRLVRAEEAARQPAAETALPAGTPRSP